MKIYTADHLLPVSSPPVEDGSMLVDGARIIAVGQREVIAAMHRDVPEERFRGAAIIPGFVNCHSHLELTALRGALDDLDHDFAGWLLKLTSIRADVLSDEDIADSAVAGALEGAKAGVTCFGDIGRWGRAGFDALRTVRLRGVLFQETEFSPGSATADEDFRVLAERLEALIADESDSVEVGISPHSPYTVSQRLFELITDLALEQELKVTIHAAESDSEQDLLTNGEGFFAAVFRKYGVDWEPPGVRSVEYLAGTGILETAPLLAHCTKADPGEIAIIAGTGSRVAHCPKSNAKFGHGIAPLADLLAAGIETGLGTDSMVSNNLCDMFEEARFAALASRIRAPRDEFLSAGEALRIATLGGAEALGLGNVTGSLEAGKFADFAVVSLSEVSRMPVHDVNSALLFASRASDVKMTVVGGETIYREGASPIIDESRLRARMAEIASKVGSANRTQARKG